MPNIEAQLRSAELTGEDIRIPAADWLAKVDPEIAKQLHDDIRVRDNGFTLNETKIEAEPKEVIPEPLTATRGSAGLEPMFSVGDRKLTVEKQPPRETAEGAIQADQFHILDDTGKKVGLLEVSPLEGGKKLYVDSIKGLTIAGYGPNRFGPHLTRDIARQLKEQYPGAEQVGGFRISGAREKAGVPLEDREVWIKFDDLEGPQGWTHIEAVRNLLDASQVDVGKAGILHYSPEFAPHEAAADKIIRDTLSKIAPGAKVFTPSYIEVPGRTGASRGGFLQPFHKQNPWIVVALDAADTLGVARHEAVHYLKQFGFFKEGEWDVLSQAAKD